MKLIHTILLLPFFSLCIYSQQPDRGPSESPLFPGFTGSDIPLVVIESNGGFPIPDEPKMKARMKIVDHGPGGWNLASDAGNIYSGNIGIEVRGSYSSTFPQKPYGLETRDSTGANLDVSLLGLPDENDWILLSNYNDKSFLRNALAGHFFREMGHYAPRTVHCEVVVNGTYQGIYVLTEKIKRDKNRVDIATLKETENSGDDVTGGYIFKTDYYASSDSWASSYPPADRPDKTVYFVYSYPEPDKITESQKQYIQSCVNTFEKVLQGVGFRNSQTGYPAYIDVNSFRDYFILSEVTRNVDAYKKSRFFFKDKDTKGGKIHSGPPWDYDWALKDIWDCPMFSNTDGSGWAYQVNECDVWPTPPVYMTRMLQDPYFANNIKSRYVALRETSLSSASIHAYIDSVTTYLDGAQQRHYATWNILGENVGAPEVGNIPKTFPGEIDKLKNWIDLRLSWLDANMPGDDNGPIQSTEQRMALFRLFPNPASYMVYVESDSPILRIEIATISGNRVRMIEGSLGYSSSIQIQDLLPGIYLVNMVTENGQSMVEKLVIQ